MSPYELVSYLIQLIYNPHVGTVVSAHPNRGNVSTTGFSELRMIVGDLGSRVPVVDAPNLRCWNQLTQMLWRYNFLLSFSSPGFKLRPAL